MVTKLAKFKGFSSAFSKGHHKNPGLIFSLKKNEKRIKSQTSLFKRFQALIKSVVKFKGFSCVSGNPVNLSGRRNLK